MDAWSKGPDMGCRIENLSVARGGRAVLAHVDLVLVPGEVAVLEGPSGSGKTTLIRAIARLIPSTGSIATGGAKPSLIFQHHALAGRLSVEANTLVGALGRVGFLRSAFGFWPAEERALARRHLAAVGLGGLEERRADQLSGGQRQRVAIARALMQRAPLMLADEPVANLDPENAEAILVLLRDLARREGIAILVSLHQPGLAERFADRRLTIVDGRLVEP
ncbi:phosphonate ABC transporter ATP-binding protein [Plastoroseomonas arctica]|uniref:ATP-binding cassette domain-containing protein n=1 Tax=Plastoroseomonas arctica TaxID=1509237 RepID=A0AAF1K651_9PROT|nr:ATP-binding cassette domain-containing protein [Plastoroseomonas arctica]MBR0656814.1 ATP-binding cassette domain-containing protein [Plastoroseomonas arctica]